MKVTTSWKRARLPRMRQLRQFRWAIFSTSGVDFWNSRRIRTLFGRSIKLASAALTASR